MSAGRLGFPRAGAPPNGASPNGVAPKGTGPNGARPNGHAPDLGALVGVASRPGKALPEGRTSPRIARRQALHRRFLALADVLAAALALAFGVVVLGDDSLQPAVLVVVPLVVIVSKVVGMYDRDDDVLHKATLDEAPELFRVATLYTVLAWIAEPLFMEGQLGRDQLLGLWGLLFVAMVAARCGGRWVARALGPGERVLVVGDAGALVLVDRKLERHRTVKAGVVGRVPPGEHGSSGDGSVLGHIQLLGLVLVEHDIDRVIIAPLAHSDPEEMLHTIRLVRSLGVHVSLLPRLFEVVGSSVEFDELEGSALLGVRSQGLSRSSRALKRAVDLVGAGLGLVVLAPLLGLLAAAIKFDTRGPVLFRQRRVGRDECEFEMLKLRTMVEGAEARKASLLHRNEASGLFKIEEDPRITRVGRFLRRSSLDELGQLLNVLRGEMSLVGPRPLVPADDRNITGWDRRRLMVRPGMTGLWQIFGGARVPLEEMVKIDYLYGANWSLWLDVKVMLRTVPYMLGGRGL